MTQLLEVSIGQCSLAGRKEVNQDFYGAYVPAGAPLASKGISLAIADGISTSNVSQIASEAAVTGFLNDYYSTPEAWSVRSSAQRVLEATNSWLYAQTQRSERRFNRDWGYVCTFSALILKSNTAHLFHTGDTRIYRVLGDSLELLTTDHARSVSPETSYLTQALGFRERLELDYQQVDVSEGDTFVLASDGVYDFLKATELSEVLKTAGDLDAAASTVVSRCLERGSADNLTLQILRVDHLPPRRITELYSQLETLELPPPLQARTEFDGYSIVRELHISPRSHVFLAQDLTSDKRVVLKAPSAEKRTDDAYLEAFLMEDWVARRIDNPHVVKAEVTDRPRRYVYFAMEYIEGQTLEQWMRDNPNPSLQIVREIVSQIVRGLQSLHRQEMMHRDLRPANIMIDSLNTVRIIDLGSVSVAGLSERGDRSEGVVGTAQYTAPECYMGMPDTAQSDIFSLGVIVYQMLCGALPYGNSVAKAGSARELNRLGYRSLGDQGREAPAWLDFALQKALSIDPRKRYAEAFEFAAEIDRPSTEYLQQTKRPLLERNPTLFWKCVAAALLTVVVAQCGGVI